MLIAPYKPKFFISLKGALLLVVGSIVIGLLAGIAADKITRVFYLVIIFPVLFSFLILVVFKILLKFAKVYDKWMTLLMALLIAMICSGTFLFKEYTYTCEMNSFWCYSNNLINESGYKLPYGEHQINPSIGGFINYLIINAEEGVDYENYLAYGTIQIFRFGVFIHGYTYWLFELVETLFFGFGLFWYGFVIERQPFNHRARQWYQMTRNCIGALPENVKDQFLQLMNENQLDDARKLIVAQSEIEHPKIEVYQNYPPKSNGDLLITIRSTHRNIFGKIIRRNLYQFEAIKID